MSDDKLFDHEGREVAFNAPPDPPSRRAPFAAPITRAEAVAELKNLTGSKRPDDAHAYADHLLLRLLNDPEIAAAWYDVPKWYA